MSAWGTTCRLAVEALLRKPGLEPSHAEDPPFPDRVLEPGRRHRRPLQCAAQQGCRRQQGIGALVELVHWNVTVGRAAVRLRSARAQRIELRFGIDVRFVGAESADVGERVAAAGRGAWQVDPPAGETLRLQRRR